jgi:hypothetical protein
MQLFWDYERLQTVTVCDSENSRFVYEYERIHSAFVSYENSESWHMRLHLLVVIVHREKRLQPRVVR